MCIGIVCIGIVCIGIVCIGIVCIGIDRWTGAERASLLLGRLATE